MIRPATMLQFLAAAVILTACTDGASAESVPGGNPGEPVVFSDNGFTLAITPGEDSLRISVTAPTDGWVAVGFEPTRVMKDADIYIGYVENGRVFLRDDFGTGNTAHASDESLGGTSGFTSLEGSESDGNTSISFTIARDSGDSYDKVITRGGSYKVIMGYGPEGSDDFTTYHEWVESADLIL
jgi:hypothetical protein